MNDGRACLTAQAFDLEHCVTFDPDDLLPARMRTARRTVRADLLGCTTVSRVNVAVLVSCALLYASALALLAREPGFSLVEPLFVLIVVGGVFSALAWATTRRTAAALEPQPVAGPRDVVAVLAYLALFAALVLGFGFTAVKDTVTTEPAQSIALLVVKLVTMVALPLALLVFLRD